MMIRQAAARISANAPAVGPAAAATQLLGTSAVHTSSGVERFGSHMSHNDPETLTRAKEKQLKGETPEVMPGVPG